jgi:hypothetical protein
MRLFVHRVSPKNRAEFVLDAGMLAHQYQGVSDLATGVIDLLAQFGEPLLVGRNLL